MRKIHLFIAISVLVLGCEKSTVTREINGGIIPASSREKYEAAGYKGQLPYITVSDGGEALTAFNLKHDWHAKEKDNSISWSIFDAEYSDTAPTEIRQHVAISILVKKDLIALAKESPDNQKYQNALKKYISVLTSTEYIGYSVLYASLDAVTDADFRRTSANAIKNYSPKNDFHSAILADPDLKGNLIRVKVEEDYAYLEKITELTE